MKTCGFGKGVTHFDQTSPATIRGKELAGPRSAYPMHAHSASRRMPAQAVHPQSQPIAVREAAELACCNNQPDLPRQAPTNAAFSRSEFSAHPQAAPPRSRSEREAATAPAQSEATRAPLPSLCCQRAHRDGSPRLPQNPRPERVLSKRADDEKRRNRTYWSGFRAFVVQPMPAAGPSGGPRV